jgi:hypothetical protein
MKLNLDNYLPAPHMLAISGCHLFLVENMLIVSKTKTCTSMDLKKKKSHQKVVHLFLKIRKTNALSRDNSC